MTGLHELPAQIWASLATGARVPEDSFRTAVLATSSPAGCAVRTVVLQYALAEARLLACSSDARAVKIRQIQLNSQVAWVFYDPRTRTQVRADGAATVHMGNDTARRSWQLLPLPQRFQYCSPFAPGTPVSSPQTAQGQPGSELTDLEVQAGFSNFAVIESVIHGFDWLRLDSSGNRRAELVWDGREYVGRWLAP